MSSSSKIKFNGFSLIEWTIAIAIIATIVPTSLSAWQRIQSQIRNTLESINTELDWHYTQQFFRNDLMQATQFISIQENELIFRGADNQLITYIVASGSLKRKMPTTFIVNKRVAIQKLTCQQPNPTLLSCTFSLKNATEPIIIFTPNAT